MEIIYKQGNNSPLSEKLGIENCYVRMLFSGHDILTSTKKMHHHTFFELHFVQNGVQKYESDGKYYTASCGDMLIIPPETNHRLVERDASDSKLSVTFSVNSDSCFSNVVSGFNTPLVINVPASIESNFTYILEEKSKKCSLSYLLMENRILETIVEIMRIFGFKSYATKKEDKKEDARLTMAKQYIKDNIEINPKLPEVAAYCYLGTKQLTRLFKQYENITPAKYIQKERTAKIIELMSSALSLAEISEIMNFSSEYHFNSFFKKMESQPPGEYRRMLR